MGEDAKPEKLVDFERDPEYEQRVVVFYDFLGWRDEIANAHQSPAKIGRLRRGVLQHARMLRLPAEVPVNVTTFSDNIVISTAPGWSIPYLLRGLATIQFVSASHGFFLRGGITVGDIIHDNEVVFGPALNRAYELESKVAVYPRIVIDEPVLKCGDISGFNSYEDGLHFLDPFTVEFANYIVSERAARQGPSQQFLEAGLPSPDHREVVPGDIMLRMILETVKEKIRRPLADKEWSKLAWLFDRMAAQLGVPPASSYPRVYPLGSGASQG